MPSRHRQDLAQGLPLTHPKIPTAPREKNPLRILEFKLSYIMSRAKCHESWVSLVTFNLTDSFPLSICRSTRGPNRAMSAWRQWKPCWFMRTKYWKFKTISAFTSQMDFLFALWLFTREQQWLYCVKESIWWKWCPWFLTAENKNEENGSFGKVSRIEKYKQQYKFGSTIYFIPVKVYI